MIKPLFFHLLAIDHFQGDFLNKLCMGSFKKYVVFDLPPPLFVPVRFACTHVPSPPQLTFALVSYPPPPLKKCPATLMTFISKKISGGMKSEKRINFFINST